VKSLKKKKPLEIILYQSLLKSSKMDLIIQKVSEAGVSQIVPVISERSQLREISGNRLRRWQKIIEGACAQSLQPNCPRLEELQPFSRALDWAVSQGNTWLFWENEAEEDPISIFLQTPPQGKLAVFIGPEGGFTQREVVEAREKGGKILSLGEQTYRAETAAILAVGLISLLTERSIHCQPKGKAFPKLQWKYM